RNSLLPRRDLFGPFRPETSRAGGPGSLPPDEQRRAFHAPFPDRHYQVVPSGVGGREECQCYTLPNLSTIFKKPPPDPHEKNAEHKLANLEDLGRSFPIPCSPGTSLASRQPHLTDPHIGFGY